MNEENYDEVHKSPLCAFALSPLFSLQIYDYPSSKRLVDKRFSLSRKLSGHLKTKKSYFKTNNRRNSNTSLTKFLTGIVTNHNRETLNLQEVLNTVKQVWNSPIEVKSPSVNSSTIMDESLRKTSCASSDIPSPVLLRRRLSAPETIMRKHMLAQQRSDSQDSDVTQASDVRSCQWRSDLGSGSDPNLNKRRDLGLMRKSTLLRRMWSNNTKSILERNNRITGAYNEWQHSFGKLSSGKSTHSLGSNHSSPEHIRRSLSRRSLNGDDIKTSPKLYNKINIKQEINENDFVLSPNIKISTASKTSDDGNIYPTSFCSNCSNITISESSRGPMSLTNTRTSTTTVTPKTTETERDNYTSTVPSTTTFSDNSDSAYTNSHSNFSSNDNNSRSTVYSSDIQKHIEEQSEECNENVNETINNQLKCVSNNNNMNNNNNNTFIKYVSNVNESSTQTPETTNLNVISNVQLSQSTLDLIFNRVLQDVQNTLPSGLNINTLSTTSMQSDDKKVDKEIETKLINVQQVPSFYLKRKEEININPEQHNRIVKYMISNVGTGSTYSKPAEVPQVVIPRFSALPRSSSMEVNTSSGESTDKESDTVSLVDSLEDPSSPRIDSNQINKHDDKPVRGDLNLLLPDNSNKKKNKTNKPEAFFIPIETTKHTDVKSVSELLPEKVRDKLTKRHVKRELKIHKNKNKIISPRSDSNYISASENGNNINFIIDNNDDFNLNKTPNVLPEVNYNKPKKRSKPILPSIETIRKIKIDSRDNTKYFERDNKQNKTKRKENITENSSARSKQSHWSSKSRQKQPEKLSPLYTSKNEYVYDAGPKRIYHKTELNNSNKRIEILEIMECVDTTNERYHNNYQKGKSKIPVLVHSKLPKIPSCEQRKSDKPTYLDFDEVHFNDPKIDQLIANILIDTLNKTETVTEQQQKLAHKININEKRPSAAQPSKHQGTNKYQQRFAVIPEERSLQSSIEDQNNTLDGINKNCNNTIEETAKLLVKQTLENNNVDDISNNTKIPEHYKGKASLAVVKDENFSTIPKGWITFYMLHKNQGSPDSTSDEGTKDAMDSTCTNNINNNEKTKEDEQHTIIKDNIPNNNEKLNDTNKKLGKNVDRVNLVSAYSTSTYKVTRKEKNRSPDDTIDNFSSSDTENVHCDSYHPLPSNNNRFKKHNTQKKGRFRNSNNNNQHSNAGWSVTVSGINTCGEYGPDLEMRLKFPQNHQQPPSQSDSGLGEEHPREKRTNFPYLDNKKSHNIVKRFESSNEDGKSTVESTYRQKLPEIVKNKQRKTKRCDSSITLSSMVPAKIEPRQTRTSTRRFSLNKPRPRLPLPHPEELTVDERQLAEVLRCLPHILTITGNAISPERKPRVSTMSERDLTRNIYTNN